MRLFRNFECNLPSIYLQRKQMQMTKVLKYMELAYNLCPDALLIFGIDWPDIYRKKGKPLILRRDYKYLLFLAAKKPDDLRTTHEEANTVVAPTDAFIVRTSTI